MNPVDSIALWRHQLEIYGELRLSRENARRLMSYAEIGASSGTDMTDHRQAEQMELPIGKALTRLVRVLAS